MTVGIMEHKSTLEDAVSCSGVQNIQVSTKQNSIFLSSFILKGVYEMLNLSKYFLIQFAYLFI